MKKDNQIRICHITTVHIRYDNRVFFKECITLGKEYSVNLIVADGNGDEVISGIHIFDIGLRQTSRIKRALMDTRRAFKKAQELDCTIYHFHDPELINVGKKLIGLGKVVIYDVHEDVPNQILSKPYLNKISSKIVSRLYRMYEKYSVKNLSGIITSTPSIKQDLLNFNPRITDILNYPIINNALQSSSKNKTNRICYVGVIAGHRGILELLDSLSEGNYILNLAGKFEDKQIQKKCLSHKNWKLVEYFGYVSKNEVTKILNSSKIGIVTIHPLQRHLFGLPVKLFEYMSAGIPVIASNIPYWQDIIERADCGICVDPLNPSQIQKATKYLLNNQEVANKMGENGRKAVENEYNWQNQAEKLLRFYKNYI